MAALQKRIHALEADLNSARGESAIIRSNSTKAQQDHAAEVARLRKQNAEQEARNQRLLEAAVMKEKHATTELEFLQRDIQETTVRTKRNDPVQPPKGPVNGQSTPKRGNKTWAMADGFEDLDMIPSPSKSKGKSRDAGGIAGPLGERTPTRNKRKRPIMDSPVLALETHEAEPEVVMKEATEVMAPSATPAPPGSILPCEASTISSPAWMSLTGFSSSLWFSTMVLPTASPRRSTCFLATHFPLIPARRLRPTYTRGCL